MRILRVSDGSCNSSIKIRSTFAMKVCSSCEIAILFTCDEQKRSNQLTQNQEKEGISQMVDVSDRHD